MSFKSLEQRYNEKVNILYSGAKNKFDNGKTSGGRNDDPLIVRAPGNGYWSKVEGRGLPILSAAQDVKRLTLFTLSVRGISFLAKQQLLQTGNTFEQTRLINPLFAVGNAVPFLHIRRHLRPLTGPNGLLTKTDKSDANVRKLGQLQESTYNDALSKGKKPSFFKSIGNQLLSPIKNTISAFTAKKNIGEILGYDESGWAKTRPELGKIPSAYVLIGKRNDQKLSTAPDKFSGTRGFNIIDQKYGIEPSGDYTKYYDVIREEYPKLVTNYTTNTNAIVDSQIKSTSYLLYSLVRTNFLKTVYETGEINSQNGASRKGVTTNKNAIDAQRGIISRNKWYEEETGDDSGLPYLTYFIGDPESITAASQFDPSNVNSTNAKYLAENRLNKSKKISYIKDPSNMIAAANAQDLLDVQPAYKSINGDFDDAIIVSFAMGNDSPIRFRSYVKDMVQSATPEYKSYQYIGRIEKFISYTSVQRDISFKLGIIAFSKDEIDGVWRRINYLTGLVFPYGFNRGIYQPNITRLTIGNVYVDQPGYITSLNTNFNTITETWNIDKNKQVPISAEIDIKFIIIEKKTKIADSPFYNITEKMPGFSDQITGAGSDLVATVGGAPATPTTPATIQQESTSNQFINPVYTNRFGREDVGSNFFPAYPQIPTTPAAVTTSPIYTNRFGREDVGANFLPAYPQIPYAQRQENTVNLSNNPYALSEAQLVRFAANDRRPVASAPIVSEGQRSSVGSPAGAASMFSDPSMTIAQYISGRRRIDFGGFSGIGGGSTF
jgi:hypothetical protein